MERFPRLRPDPNGRAVMAAERRLIRRRCARVLVVDEDDRVLLFFSSGFVAPGVEYYVTVGGGVDPGETLAEAAARELLEETGLRVDPDRLGPVVAYASGEWSDNPAELVLQEDLYFCYRTPTRRGTAWRKSSSRS
ncbi:hypothetical protein GCM10029992_13460 [Glycomyces albus]